MALGSNLGDRRATLSRALTWLSHLPGTELAKASGVYRTPAFGPPQPDYLNAVVRLKTALPPLVLLDALHGLEGAAGRIRDLRWGPRTLDLDLLLYGEGGRARLTHPRLALPHPRMHERNFVLAPLAEIDPHIVLPNGLTVEDTLRALQDTSA